MRTKTLWIVALSGLLQAGCAYVTSSEPVGQEPFALPDKVLAQTWIHDGGPVRFSAVDGARGIYRITWVEDGEQRQVDALLRQFPTRDPGQGFETDQPTWTIWNVKVADFMAAEHEELPAEDDPMEDQALPGHYFWGRLRVREDELLFWGPSAERLAALVAAGTLPGEMDGDNVRLGKLEAEHLLIITGGSHGVLMDWDDPLVMHRSASAEQPDNP